MYIPFRHLHLALQTGFLPGLCAALDYFGGGLYAGGWEPGLYTLGGGLLGMVVANLLFLAAIR